MRRRPSFLGLAAAGEAALLLAALALAQLFNLHPFANFHPSWRAALWGAVATLPLLVGLAWVMTRSRGPLHDLTRLVVEQIGPMLAQRPMLEIGLIAALAGLAEEVFFRGVIQDGLMRLVPWLLALAAASALFGLAHFASTTYAVWAGVMGLYLGVLYLLQGSLLAPIIAHALYDLVALVVVARVSRGDRLVPRDV